MFINALFRRLAGPSWFFTGYIFLFQTQIRHYYYYRRCYTRVPASVKNEFRWNDQSFSELFHRNGSCSHCRKSTAGMIDLSRMIDVVRTKAIADFRLSRNGWHTRDYVRVERNETLRFLNSRRLFYYQPNWPAGTVRALNNIPDNTYILYILPKCIIRIRSETSSEIVLVRHRSSI